jgi:hypothetical protein
MVTPNRTDEAKGGKSRKVKPSRTPAWMHDRMAAIAKLTGQKIDEAWEQVAGQAVAETFERVTTAARDSK